MLNNLEPRTPLNLAEDLCDYSRNLLQNQLKIFPGSEAMSNMGDGNNDDGAAAGPLMDKENAKQNERKRKQTLKAQQK